jgi:excinuclease ABC subunit B
MYADTISSSMKKAISETERRRKIQIEYNKKHHIIPSSIKKAVAAVFAPAPPISEVPILDTKKIPPDEIKRIIKDLTNQMNLAAQNLEFEKAALLRDQIKKLKQLDSKREI